FVSYRGGPSGAAPRCPTPHSPSRLVPKAMPRPDVDWTNAAPLPSQKAPGIEPLPGYRLLAPLGQGGSSEVCKCEAPGGLLKAVKFVHGSLGLDDGADAPAEEELQALQRIKTIRHPFLLSLDRVEQCGNELLIVLELADCNLGDVLAREQQAG